MIMMQHIHWARSALIDQAQPGLLRGRSLSLGEQIMQINKQNRNVNIYGYDILIGRDAADSRGVRARFRVRVEIYELANVSGFLFFSGQLGWSKITCLGGHKIGRKYLKYYGEMSLNQSQGKGRRPMNSK